MVTYMSRTWRVSGASRLRGVTQKVETHRVRRVRVRHLLGDTGDVGGSHVRVRVRDTHFMY